MEVRHLGNGFGAKNTLMPYISKSSICISSMLSYTALDGLKTKQLKAIPPPPNNPRLHRQSWEVHVCLP